MPARKNWEKTKGVETINSARDDAAEHLISITHEEQKTKEVLMSKQNQNSQNLKRNEEKVADLIAESKDLLLADQELEACLKVLHEAVKLREALEIQLDRSCGQLDK